MDKDDKGKTIFFFFFLLNQSLVKNGWLVIEPNRHGTVAIFHDEHIILPSLNSNGQPYQFQQLRMQVPIVSCNVK